MKPWRAWTNCWREWDMPGRRGGCNPCHPDDNRESDNEIMKLPTNREELMVNTDHVPQGWHWVRLGDVCERPEYGASASARPFDPALARYVRITDITDDGRLKADGACSADPEQVDGYELGQGDLLFARSGSVGRTYLYRPQDGPCVFAGYLIRFRPDPNVALPRYVERYTHSDTYRRWVASMLRVGAQANINAVEYSSLPILLPPIAEQRRIVSVVDGLDEAIDRTDAVIATTEKLREGMLGELLTRGVPGTHWEWKHVPNFGEIPNNWKVVRLGDVAEVNPKRPRLDISPESPVTFLPMASIGENGAGIVEPESREFRDVAKGFTYFEENDVLFAKITPCLQNGKHALATGLTAGLGFGTTEFHVVRAGPKIEHSHLLRVLTRPANIEKCVRSFSGTAGQQRVHPEILRSLPVLLPPLTEQQAVAALLDSVDEQMRRIQGERDALALLRTSVTAKLLSGSVRVPLQP